MATVALQNVCELDRRTTAASAAEERGLEFVGMEHVDPETGRIVLGRGSRTGEGKGQAFLFDDRHVLFGKLRPYLRKIALPREAGCASTELVPLLPDARRLDRAYLFHWVRRQSVIDALMAKNTGARMPRADMSVLLGMSITIPSLDEQRRAVTILDRAAEIRRRAGAARAKASALIPALFLHMFGDPVSNPKGWDTPHLGNVLCFGPQNGLYRPASDYGDGVRILRIDSFDNGTIGNQSGLKRLRIEPDLIDKFGLREGDIVVNRVNSPPQLGKSVLIPRLSETTVFESNMMRMRVNEGVVSPTFVGAMLQLDSIRQSLIKNAKHAINQSSINQGDVAGITVLAPPLPLQTAFAKRARRIEATVHALDSAAAKAEAMAAALSAEVFEASPTRGNGHAPA
jgi:type I restriction enzyme S subunit